MQNHKKEAHWVSGFLFNKKLQIDRVVGMPI